MRLALLTDRVAAQVWETLRPHIVALAETSAGELNERVIAECVMAGDMQLWAAIDDGDRIAAAMLTKPIHYKTGLKVLEIYVLAGRMMESWLELEDEFAALAASNGYRKLRLIGRKGFERKLTKWQRVAVLLERDISPAMVNGHEQ